jgi:hypothetical protein
MKAITNHTPESTPKPKSTSLASILTPEVVSRWNANAKSTRRDYRSKDSESRRLASGILLKD